MIKLFNQDNVKFNLQKETGVKKVNMILADYIYENLDFGWVEKYWSYLETGGIFVAITDYHSSAEYKVFTQQLPRAHFVNWLTWKNEFGNFRKDRFRQCHDDIIIFSKYDKFRFDANKVQVPKATAKSKGLNKSGRETKIATSVITDITLTTIAKERIKDSTGKNVRWQKPKQLLDRIMKPFLLENDIVLDPFAGSGTCGEVCADNNWHYVGIEYDKKIFKLAEKRLKPYFNDKEYIPF